MRLFKYLSFFAVLAAVISLAGQAWPVTVQEVAHELKCPCGCPLVLEDCNMRCGLDWKDRIGEEIKAGKTKDEIVRHFMDKYGEACRITPYKRVRSKIYQYTRGFDTREWVIVAAGAAVWTGALFFGVFLVIKRLSRKNKGGGEGV